MFIEKRFFPSVGQTGNKNKVVSVEDDVMSIALVVHKKKLGIDGIIRQTM